MLRQGPIPAFVHGVLGYLFGVLLIAAPFLLEFDSGAATAASIVLGVTGLIVEAASDTPTGLAKVIPVSVHVVLDFVLAAALIAAPFLFGFSDKGGATSLFLVLGVAGVLITIATRFLPRHESAAAA